MSFGGGGSISRVLQKYGCVIQTTAPYSPEMNSVERVHKSLMARIRALRYSMGIPWSECLYMATYGYNITEHSMLEISPYALLFSNLKDVSGKTTNIENINDLRQQAANKAYKMRLKGLEKTKKLRKKQNWNIGDIVYVLTLNSSKLEDRILDTPFRIRDIQGKSSKKFTLVGPDNVILEQSSKHI